MNANINLIDLAHELETTPLPEMKVWDEAKREWVKILVYILDHPNASLDSSECGDGTWVDYGDK